MEIENYLRNFPPFTKYYLLLTTINFWICRYNPYIMFYICYSEELIFEDYELWRIISSFLLTAYEFKIFITSMLIVNIFMHRLEVFYERKYKAFYLILLIFVSMLIAHEYFKNRWIDNIDSIYYFFFSNSDTLRDLKLFLIKPEGVFFSTNLLFWCLYFYSKLKPNEEINIIFTFKMKYSPWIMIGIHFIIEGKLDLGVFILSYLIAHIWFLIKDRIPILR